MLYRFAPLNPAVSPSSVDPKLGKGAPMLAGREYKVAPEWAASVIASVPGIDGPCLVAAKAVEPEQPAAETPAPSPKKRGRGK